MAESTAAAAELKLLKHFCGRVPGQVAGTKAHLSTLIRHATLGVKGPDGRVVRLRATRLGNKWLTTEAKWAEFVDALTTGDAPVTTPRTPTARQRQADLADAELAARGV